MRQCSCWSCCSCPAGSCRRWLSGRGGGGPHLARPARSPRPPGLGPGRWSELAALLEVDGVTKRFGGVVAVDHCSFTVGEADQARADELLAEFGLTSAADQSAAELSYGQRKLLELATVLMGRPRLVLLDEPTAGINPAMVPVIERHVRAHHARGVTFLIVEHDMGVVMRLCDPVVVLERGSVITTGPPAAVQADPRVLDAYLGA